MRDFFQSSGTHCFFQIVELFHCILLGALEQLSTNAINPWTREILQTVDRSLNFSNRDITSVVDTCDDPRCLIYHWQEYIGSLYIQDFLKVFLSTSLRLLIYLQVTCPLYI